MVRIMSFDCIPIMPIGYSSYLTNFNERMLIIHLRLLSIIDLFGGLSFKKAIKYIFQVGQWNGVEKEVIYHWLISNGRWQSRFFFLNSGSDGNNFWPNNFMSRSNDSNKSQIYSFYLVDDSGYNVWGLRMWHKVIKNKCSTASTTKRNLKKNHQNIVINFLIQIYNRH